MLLRADLHRAWDKMRFVHVPKRGIAGKMELVTHLLVYSRELGELYHNTRLHQLGVARESLLARFAWTIFPQLSGFLQQGHDRYLLRVGSEKPEYVSADECFEYGESWKPANQRASRNPSPSKRSRKDAGIDECDDQIDQLAAKRARHRSPSKDGAGAGASTISKPIVTAKYSTEQTTPNLMSSQDTVHIVPPNSIPLSERVEHRETLRALYESGLKVERARSDPEGRWGKHMEKEKQWLDEVFENGGAVDAKEMARFMRAWGQDIIEDEQRLCCIGELECQCGYVGTRL
ncbi:MAG: hypothetical protein Q9214_005974 [Letrouitia sp. 1 TL-2023]